VRGAMISTYQIVCSEEDMEEIDYSKVLSRVESRIVEVYGRI